MPILAKVTENESIQKDCEIRIPSIQLETATTSRLRSYTRCSAIAERPRCRVRYSFRQK